MSTSVVTTSGLAGVVVADTRLSKVDGARGELIIRGYSLEDLVGRAGFEGACALLWGGALPEKSAERGRIRELLGAARVEAFETLPRGALSLPDAMASMRAAVAQMPLPESTEPEVRAAALVGALGVWAPAWDRLRQGRAPEAPDPTLDHGADYLRMVHGQPPTAAMIEGINTYMVSVCDHGMNASTFTARVVASTGSDLVSAVTAAIGALKGPLHGGAPGPVLDMLDAIGVPSKARGWLEAALDGRRRIMGMGHRVYRVRDPRAAVREVALTKLEGDTGAADRARLALARAVEREAEALLAARYPERPLRANVEFYTAVLLEGLGLPRELFSATFCASRAAGWCGHVFEEREGGRLIRPKARYVGP